MDLPWNECNFRIQGPLFTWGSYQALWDILQVCSGGYVYIKFGKVRCFKKRFKVWLLWQMALEWLWAFGDLYKREFQWRIYLIWVWWDTNYVAHSKFWFRNRFQNTCTFRCMNPLSVVHAVSIRGPVYSMNMPYRFQYTKYQDNGERRFEVCAARRQPVDISSSHQWYTIKSCAFSFHGV